MEVESGEYMEQKGVMEEPEKDAEQEEHGMENGAGG